MEKSGKKDTTYHCQNMGKKKVSSGIGKKFSRWKMNSLRLTIGVGKFHFSRKKRGKQENAGRGLKNLQ